jgi:GH25 family lysozyme M1 (1,4-beta-N-acetylmuramidase)
MPPAIFQLLPNDRTPDHIWRIASGAPIAKTCVPANSRPIRAYGCIPWLRYYAGGDDGLGVDPSAWAHQCADECRAAGTYPSVITPRNEVAPNDFVGVWYARWRLAMEREGCPPSTVLLLPSFPQGTPDGPAIRAIFHACQAEDPQGRPPAGLDLHEYGDLTIPGSSPWHTLRCKMLLEEGWIPRGTPIYIGECLIDAVSRGGSGPDASHPLEDPQGRSGWADRSKMQPADVVAQLNLYLAQLPPEVVCAAWFVDGEAPGGRWWNYRSWDTEIETAIRKSWQGATMPTLRGIDVSAYQPSTNWAQVAASGVAFAFIKATEGVGYVNPQFAHDWQAAKAAGLVRGAYHFAQPSQNPNGWAAEVDHFLATVGALEPGDLLVLDLEVGNGDLSGWASNWFSRAITRAGFRPFLYSYGPFIDAHNLHGLSSNPLWLAAYQSQQPPTPAGWTNIAIWQHSDKASVPGVQGNVDENVTSLSLDQLKALGKQGGSPAVDPAETYYFQNGIKVDTSHALWTAALKPLYDFAQSLKAQGNPIFDLVNPGPITGPEAGATWGGTRPAATVKLSNRVIGVYQKTDGTWAPYQASLP